MIPFHQSIGFRLLGISLILLAVPLLVDSFIFLENRFEAAQEEAKSILKREVGFRAVPIASMARTNREVAMILAHFFHLRTQFPEKADPALNEKLEQLSVINQYKSIILAKRVTNNQLRVVASSLPAYTDQNVTDLFASFVSPPHGHDVATGLVFDRITASPLFVTVFPVINGEGAFTGILALMSDLNHGIAELLAPISNPYQINLALLLPSTVVFAGSDKTLESNYFRTLSPAEAAQIAAEIPPTKTQLPLNPLQIVDQTEKPFIKFFWNSRSQIGVIEPIPELDIQFLGYTDQKSLLWSIGKEFILIYGTYLIVLLIGLVVAILWARRMGRPLSMLSSVMHQIETGDLEARYIPDSLGFEINRLGEIFNQMVATLIEKEKVVEEERVQKETLSKELKLGHKVQLALLPLTTPVYPGIEIGHAFVPAIQVGGDFFDLFVKDNGQLVLSVADASGKGVYACLYSLTLKNMLRTFALVQENLHEAMRQANNVLCEDTGDSGMFVTVLMAQYDHQTREFKYHSCGHNPILHYRAADQTARYHESPGMAMGVLERGEKGEPNHLKLASGDIIVLYSDGVTEAHNIHKELFGEERLKKYIEIEAGRSAVALTQGLMEELTLFAGGAKQHDDITLIILKVE